MKSVLNFHKNKNTVLGKKKTNIAECFACGKSNFIAQFGSKASHHNHLVLFLQLLVNIYRDTVPMDEAVSAEGCLM